MRNFLSILAIIIAFSVLGCDTVKSLTESDVTLVKNGMLEFDKSLTVGQAIDNYKYFKSVKWEAIKTENGRRLVQANAILDLDKHPTINKSSEPLTKEVQLQFQFLVNQDKTFEFAWAGFRIEKADGSVIEPAQQTNMTPWFRTLKAIYGNTPNI